MITCNKKVVCWWSGGLTSAVACKIALDFFGVDNCVVIMMDTRNEDADTYRFKKDCESWYGKEIQTIDGFNDRYQTIEEVWRKYLSLNVAKGAVCSSELKRKVREKFEKTHDFDFQVFGFEFEKKEFNRAMGLKKIKSDTKAIFPLLMFGYDKEDCIRIVRSAGIEIPATYRLGFHNNNCFGTGCVQGGIGYWQKMKRDFPDKFEKMAQLEHDLTNEKGEPVTMLKDQSNEAEEAVRQTGLNWKRLVFLKAHPDYPELKCLDDMPLRSVAPLNDCNGFCGTNLFTQNTDTKNELNFEQ